MISILLVTYSRKEFEFSNSMFLSQIEHHVQPIRHGIQNKLASILLIMRNKYAVYQWEETLVHSLTFSILLIFPMNSFSFLKIIFRLLRKKMELSLLLSIFNFPSKWRIQSFNSFYINFHYYQNVIKTYSFHLQTILSSNTIDYVVIHHQNNNKNMIIISSISLDLIKYALKDVGRSLKVLWSFNRDQIIRAMLEIIKAASEISIYTIKKSVIFF